MSDATKLPLYLALFEIIWYVTLFELARYLALFELVCCLALVDGITHSEALRWWFVGR